ncbi:MAG: PhoU domain-containing protein [Planctomycetia bacterium]|nr:PhoU domain-containing protein [Planctomycetia bacterium]
MWKEIVSAWRGQDLLGRMFSEFDKMLEHTHWMFQQATDVVSRKQKWEDVRDELYARDRQVNSLERSVRRKIIEHLTLRPRTDVPACLMLMSVVKDAERIGDYCKNLFEVGMLFPSDFTPRAGYIEPLNDIRKRVNKLFVDATRAFRETDAEAGREVMRTYGAIGRDCEAIVRKLLSQEHEIGTDEGVACTLLARHYKRVGAHLANITSTVVAPLHAIDFMDEKHIPPEAPKR